jgi:hypothetical protein
MLIGNKMIRAKDIIEAVTKKPPKYEFKEFLSNLNKSCGEHIEGDQELDEGKRCAVFCTLSLSRKVQQHSIRKFLDVAFEPIFSKFIHLLNGIFGNAGVDFGSLFSQFNFKPHKAVLKVQALSLVSSDVSLEFSFSNSMLKEESKIPEIISLLSKIFDQFSGGVNEYRKSEETLSLQDKKDWMSKLGSDVSKKSGFSLTLSNIDYGATETLGLSLPFFKSNSLSNMELGKEFPAFYELMKTRGKSQWKGLESFIGSTFKEVQYREGFILENSGVSVSITYMTNSKTGTDSVTNYLRQIVCITAKTGSLFYLSDIAYNLLVDALADVFLGFNKAINHNKNQPVKKTNADW